ncbi:MAG TPA: VWA domain-containing protein, partial [Gemmataceae bacterium]|nr:VWA domain-containing protein [Gemmataceae bacterium]
MPESPGPSWKHSAGQAPRGAAGRPGASRKAWQPGRPQATRGPVDPRVKYRRRLIAATLSGAVLVALVIGLILWWGPYKRPTLVVVAPDAPDSTVAPSNSAGAAGARSFYDAFRSARESPRPKSEPNSTAGVGDWQQAIDDSSAPLFLYFACPGAADRSGPYLWLVPAGAGIASATEQRLTITQVLNHLKTLPARRQKVLVLDAATEPVSWTRGHLHNDFARRLKALDAEIKAVPNLVVICSADDDQRSWVSEEWRQTAFGHYLQEGLKGAAGSANARVSAFELFGYVQKAVSQWAQANRDTQQTPILLPSQDADDTRNGESRAKNIEIATRGSDSYVARAPSEAPGYRFTVPDALRTAWERYDELEKSKDLSAQPETKAPNLWRQYLDLLLRAEHAARVTGDVPEPIVLKLRQLADQLAAPLWGAPPACMPFSLPAGPALGYRRPELRPEQFQVLWGHAKPADAWDELIRGKDVDRARLTVADSLVRYLQTQAPDRAALDRAEKLLEVVEVGKGRPVETHLVRTFRQHLAANQDPKLVRQAIAVQVEAERAAWYAGPGTDYPYAEQVALWFRQDLEVADKHRRDGTDLVFAGDAKSAAAAAKDLDAAQELYRALAEKAAALGAAYRLRDRALTRLPYYARWAAGRRVRTDEAQPELDRITQIAEKAHALADLLTAPDPGQLREVGRLVAELNGPDGLFRKLETDFQTSLARLSDQALPANWYALDNTLNVPFIPVRTRMDLLEKLRLVSRQLHENADPQDARPGGPVSPKEMAQRQGKMALAILGERRFTEFRGASLTWKEVSQRVDAPALGAWWDSLAEAGERVGETFSAIARGADERGRGLSGETEAGITQAAALARLADGATVLNGNSPAAERRFRMHQLLIAQAVRAAADGWESLDKGSSQPYCLAAATSYLESAKAVLQGGPGSSMPPGWLKAINNAEAGLRHGKFDLTFPRDHIYMTDRAEERLWFGVRSTDGPNGKPVVRVAAATAPVASKDIPANEYRPLGDFASPGVRSGENLLNLSAVKAPDGTKGRVELDLLYRGRLVRRSIEAEQAEPTYHWIFHPPTGKASIVVKGDAALRSGAVAVMFDMSKSMNELDKQTESRKVRAANAVRKMLAEMPEETIVSVSFFAGKGSQIETFQPPTRWSDAATKAEAVFEKVSKRPADGGVTPLSESIVTALNGLEVLPGKDFTGFRSLIIITDGCDTAIDDINRPATSKPGEALLKQLTQGPAGNAANNPDVAV